MFNIFKKKPVEKSTVTSVVLDSDIKKEIIQSFDKGSVDLLELYTITQDAKNAIQYVNMTTEQKYAIELYQDYILYVARPLRAYELED